MKISAIIVDDEAPARRRLRRLLREHPEVEILAECGTGAQAVAALREHAVDALFLDVQMPEMSGFDVLRVVGAERLPLVVFVTAFDAFALQAFEQHAIDYLLKPFGPERVAHAVGRLRTFLAGRGGGTAQSARVQALLDATPAAQPPCLFIKCDDRIVALQPRQIDWIEAVGDYVKIHAAGVVHLTRATLSDMQARLAAEGFARIHRSRLVNLACVRAIHPASRSVSAVELADGTRLDASYTMLKEILDRLGA